MNLDERKSRVKKMSALKTQAHRAWEAGDNDGDPNERDYWVHGYVAAILGTSGKRLGLLNFEGDVLSITKEHHGAIHVYDQWSHVVMVCTREELDEWLDGKWAWTDSSGKIWNYTTEHEDARTPIEKIHHFLDTNK
jgi:hypothetical protein